MNIGIIGGGPRGLAALENLYILAAQESSLPIPLCTIFEESSWPGAGPVYSHDQAPTNWLNISIRFLELDTRSAFKIQNLEVPQFPSFFEWSLEQQLDPLAPMISLLDLKPNMDIYPRRSDLGKYLTQRFLSIAEPLEKVGYLKFLRGRVVRIQPVNQQFEVNFTKSNLVQHSAFDVVDYEHVKKNPVLFDEILLAIGHQMTKLDSQISGWKKQLNNSGSNQKLHTIAYPVEPYRHKEHNSSEVIAIRGFGLAMIDSMRALTIGRGGKFDIICPKSLLMKYKRSGDEPVTIAPFSLDGLPPVPKPMNKHIDSWFDSDCFKKQELLITLDRTIGNKENVLPRLLNLAAIYSARVFQKLGPRAKEHSLDDYQLEALALKWLERQEDDHYIFEESKIILDQIESFVLMASGLKPISFDYCIGQVWRKMQPAMYQTYSLALLDDKTIGEIIAKDDCLKRYSFGPPLASMQQVLALSKDGILNLEFTNDPKIELNNKGWTLSKGKVSIVANVMIDSVLPAPDIREVNSPLIDNLLTDFNIGSTYNDLGLITGDDSLLITERGTLPLAVLGRLAKGSLFGVDAILECFGPRSKNWAQNLLIRATIP